MLGMLSESGNESIIARLWSICSMISEILECVGSPSFSASARLKWDLKLFGAAPPDDCAPVRSFFESKLRSHVGIPNAATMKQSAAGASHGIRVRSQIA